MSILTDMSKLCVTTQKENRPENESLPTPDLVSSDKIVSSDIFSMFKFWRMLFEKSNILISKWKNCHGSIRKPSPKVPTASEREVELSVGSRFLLGDIIILCKSRKTVGFFFYFFIN